MISFRDCPSDIQILPVEMNLKKQKWLVVAIYTPPLQCKSYFITDQRRFWINAAATLKRLLAEGIIIGDQLMTK